VSSWAAPPLPERFSDRGHPPFVGRKTELEQLERTWEAVERGERQAVFLGGEPGSGKSRLAAEMARVLHDRDVAVLLGTTSPDLGYPYEALLEALNQMLTQTEEGSLASVIPDSAAELMRLTPHLLRHRSDLRGLSTRHDEYRRELFDAYVFSTNEHVRSANPTPSHKSDWVTPNTCVPPSFISAKPGRSTLVLAPDGEARCGVPKGSIWAKRRLTF
jgi:hypothetical protein